MLMIVSMEPTFRFSFSQAGAKAAGGVKGSGTVLDASLVIPYGQYR